MCGLLQFFLFCTIMALNTKIKMDHALWADKSIADLPPVMFSSFNN